MTTPAFSATVAKNGVEHFIPTTGPPVFTSAQHLNAFKLAKAREEFSTIESLFINRLSNSQWASPFHMVPKADMSRWPCGEFRRLNDITVYDRYSIPYIQEFSIHLARMSIFFKGASVAQLPPGSRMRRDMPKTTVITPFGLFDFLRTP